MAISQRLYEFSNAINKVSYLIEEGEEGWEEQLEALQIGFQEKTGVTLKVWRSLIAERDIIKSEIYRLQQHMEQKEKAAQRLFDYVEREMKKASMTEVKSPLFKIKLKLTPPRVEVTNQAVIPEEFLRTKTTVEPDKVAIKEAISGGQKVPGAELKQDLKLNVR